MTNKPPHQQREEDARAAKLAAIKEQVASGGLVIRQMTPEERKRYPKPAPRPAGEKRRRRQAR